MIRSVGFCSEALTKKCKNLKLFFSKAENFEIFEPVRRKGSSFASERLKLAQS